MGVIKILSALSPYLCGLAFVIFLTLFLLLVFSVKNRKLNKYIKFYVVILLSILGISYLQSYFLKNHLLSLESDKSMIFHSYWNGRELNDGKSFFSVLSSYKSFKTRSGSHPENENKIRIDYGDKSFSFILKNDSREKNLYWVFYPKYKCKAEIGFVFIDQKYLLYSTVVKDEGFPPKMAMVLVSWQVLV
jgi:hypothetical protein